MNSFRLARLARAASIGIALAGSASAVFVPNHAHATTLAEMSVERLTDASTVIVRGTVAETWTEMDADGTVWTRASVDVAQVLKGIDVPSRIVVDSAGGTFGEYAVEVPLAARFSETEEVVLFLDVIRFGTRYTPVAHYLGKFNIKRAPGEDRKVAFQYNMAHSRRYDGRFIPVPAADRRVYVDDLIARVEARLDVGWDGQPIPGASLDQLREINTAERRHR